MHFFNQNFKSGWLLPGLLLLFCLLYFPVFTAEYAYLDEIHQLWNNQDDSNYNMFFTQGRWLTGLLFQKFFSSISTIEQLKWLRLFSLGGWVLTAWLVCLLLQRWARHIDLQPSTVWLGGLFSVCSLSVCIFVGWASCMEVFAGVAAGLLSGHVLFTALVRQKEQVQLSNGVLLLSLVLGVASLFIYQTAFGVFLLPFFLQYLKQSTPRLHKHLVIGVGFYLLTYVVYYFLFKYGLQVSQVEASDRTGISLDLARKISFFFSGPLPQAFSLNAPFSASSLLSQVFYPVVALVWVWCLVRMYRQNRVGQHLGRIVVLFCLLALIYLPLMIAKENFASYRTLFAFNLAAFVMVVECVLPLVSRSQTRKLITGVLAVWLLLTGGYTFHCLFIGPLQQEYKAVRAYLQAHYSPGVQNVYFIRADKHLFARLHGTRIYRDEFGLPATCRDWVPEPLVRQLVLEQTGNRSEAQALNVVQFEDEAQFRQQQVSLTDCDLLIDMNALYTNCLNGD